MTHLFYLLVIFFIAFEVVVLFSERTIHNAVAALRHQEKEYGKGKVPYEVMNPKLVAYSIVGAFYWIVCLVGLMSSQWVAFVAIIVLSLVPKRWLWWRYIDTVLSILLLLFIVLNKYHFHVDLFTSIFK
jgi:hypothetical protein